MKIEKKVTVIGGGLAGCEAAYYLARHGIPVTLIEMKPKKRTPAHEKDTLGELVCSNSLKSNDPYGNACGLLKEEMRRLGSIIIESADRTKIPAGSALAVDRDNFSVYIDRVVKTHPLIEIVEEEVLALPEVKEGGDRYVMIATGPLTADALAEDIKQKLGGELHFYDASAPIVSAESIDTDSAFTGDRYGKGTGDYINCPMTREEYYTFVEELLAAEKAHLHEFEKGEIFEGCMPLEV
ncbi:MAG: methylenetetrahydrofolate--tRNA-(uracil(54)-C(5))-methyltransferase (FADH(2)-oxidizing) TrmFO, partial [Clostridia bacterium]|nr:methylenetetrahydrofolate--tRNA-(uracil(54)-C(5))-methyltransferase (FADH(2)-oxidizing) TrmFO [Clostridia bacterium]